MWSLYGILLLTTLSNHSLAQLNISREYQVKAGFIYNFTQFVEWPENSFENSKSPFIIGIVGEDPFGTALDQIVQGDSVLDHPILVRRYKLLKEVERCHLLFVSKHESNSEEEKIGSIAPGMLTVGDSPDFIDAGGMIRLETRDNNIKIIINPAAVRAADLIISSKLLHVAEIAENPKS